MRTVVIIKYSFIYYGRDGAEDRIINHQRTFDNPYGRSCFMENIIYMPELLNVSLETKEI